MLNEQHITDQLIGIVMREGAVGKKDKERPPVGIIGESKYLIETEEQLPQDISDYIREQGLKRFYVKENGETVRDLKFKSFESEDERVIFVEVVGVEG